MEKRELKENSFSWRDRLRSVLREKMSEKQISILIAAAELFGEKGFSATTTKEIARRAGVAESSVFKQHKSKDALFAALLESVTTHIFLPMLRHGLDALFGREFDSLEDFFRALFRNRLELIRENVVLLRLLLLELPYRPDQRVFFLSAIRETKLFDALDGLKARGLLPDRPAEETMGILFACLGGFFLTRFVLFPEHFAEGLDEDTERFVLFLTKGLA
ncbi:MAG: TetR/AcrR family transcriptional regulator [Clostridiales Family XIII bacterium]|jgi:AcrR family transcriptional regulator|nr:TetR/AcrR family transcriptional regulator [Clostridiales Family XIII bacterium]